MLNDTVHITSAKLRLHAWKPHPVIQKFLRTSEIIFILKKTVLYNLHDIFIWIDIEWNHRFCWVASSNDTTTWNLYFHDIA